MICQIEKEKKTKKDRAEEGIGEPKKADKELEKYRVRETEKKQRFRKRKRESEKEERLDDMKDDKDRKIRK